MQARGAVFYNEGVYFVPVFPCGGAVLGSGGCLDAVCGAFAALLVWPELALQLLLLRFGILSVIGSVVS